MASTWEELENRCYEYLKRIYGHNNSIEPYGKSDSTKADIKIKSSEGEEFFVEVKASNSQCCQFVLFPNEETEQFDFSKRNKVPKSTNCQRIISYMNGLYKNFCKVGRKGIPVQVDSTILYGLVNDFYTAKKVKFFMTEGKDIIIFPLEKLSDYFFIEAFYRRKTSGSSEPNEINNNTDIIHGLSEENISGSVEYINIGGKKRCFLHSNENLNKRRMICEEYTYQFKDNQYSKKISKNKANVFEVRRLSNTSNPNVICQLSLKRTLQDKNDLQAFENVMK